MWTTALTWSQDIKNKKKKRKEKNLTLETTQT